MTEQGTNFGLPTASVIIGGQLCNNVQHTIPHQQVTCKLSSGYQTALGVLFIQGLSVLKRVSIILNLRYCVQRWVC